MILFLLPTARRRGGDNRHIRTKFRENRQELPFTYFYNLVFQNIIEDILVMETLPSISVMETLSSISVMATLPSILAVARCSKSRQQPEDVSSLPRVPSFLNANTLMSLYCTTALYHTTVKCTALHYTALHLNTMHYTQLHCITLHCTKMQYDAQHCTVQTLC